VGFLGRYCGVCMGWRCFVAPVAFFWACGGWRLVRGRLSIGAWAVFPLWLVWAVGGVLALPVCLAWLVGDFWGIVGGGGVRSRCPPWCQVRGLASVGAVSLSPSAGVACPRYPLSPWAFPLLPSCRSSFHPWQWWQPWRAFHIMYKVHKAKVVPCVRVYYIYKYIREEPCQVAFSIFCQAKTTILCHFRCVFPRFSVFLFTFLCINA
jgi:hypothetical protein